MISNRLYIGNMIGNKINKVAQDINFIKVYFVYNKRISNNTRTHIVIIYIPENYDFIWDMWDGIIRDGVLYTPGLSILAIDINGKAYGRSYLSSITGSFPYPNIPKLANAKAVLRCEFPEQILYPHTINFVKNSNIINQIDGRLIKIVNNGHITI